MSRIVFLLSVVLALDTATGGCQNAKRRQRGINMQEYFTGRSIGLESAAAGSNQIIIGKLVKAGLPDPGAPGQTFYADASAEVVRWLHGEPEKEHRPAAVSFEYTVQKLPAATAEQVPVVGHTYILFLVERPGSAMRAIKILAADAKHVSEVERVLQIR